MPSKLRSATARANGAKSRGPKTAAGREKSSHNSLSHGLTAHGSILLDKENPEEFRKFLADFHTAYHPVTPIEIDMVHQMVIARWRMRRLMIIETALLDSESARCQPEEARVELGVAFRRLADESHSLRIFSRYEARFYRMYSRAYQNLRELQAEREKEKIPNEPKPNPTPIDSMPPPEAYTVEYDLQQRDAHPHCPDPGEDRAPDHRLCGSGPAAPGFREAGARTAQSI